MTDPTANEEHHVDEPSSGQFERGALDSVMSVPIAEDEEEKAGIPNGYPPSNANIPKVALYSARSAPPPGDKEKKVGARNGRHRHIPSMPSISKAALDSVGSGQLEDRERKVGARNGHHLHLPTMPSITKIKFPAMLPAEEDAGVQLRLTETVKDEEPPPTSSTREVSASTRAPSRLRKTLTAVGASSLGFRLAESVLSLIAIVVMCSNSQTVHARGAVFGDLRFNHFQAYRYLVAINVCVFLYSTLQFAQLAHTVIWGISIIPSILISTCVTFCCDQMFSYLLISASTSAATVAVMSHNGEMGIHLCSSYGLHSFCARADAAVTMTFFAFLAMFASTALSIYRIGVLLKDW